MVIFSKWVNLMGLKKIQTKESSRSRSGNPIWRLIIVLSFSSSEPKVELQTMTVKLPIGCLTKFKISLRQFLVKGVENQRNECRISFFDNVYFRPSKIELVLFRDTHEFEPTKMRKSESRKLWWFLILKLPIYGLLKTMALSD